LTNKLLSGVTYTRPPLTELTPSECKLWQRPPPLLSVA
jgi:hypothetical protein